MKRVRRMSLSLSEIKRSNSHGNLLEKPTPECETMKKSSSESKLYKSQISMMSPISEFPDKIRIDFEGDGPLGILFVNKGDKVLVSGISEDTVASEYIELEKNMIVTRIGDYNCEFFPYKDILDLIILRWRKFSKISIEFKIPSKIVEPILINEGCPIYNFLETHNCSLYYNCFIQLGVKTLEDLPFVEYQDLINMKMPSKPRRSIYEYIQFNKGIPKNTSQVFPNPDDDFSHLITDDV